MTHIGYSVKKSDAAEDFLELSHLYLSSQSLSLASWSWFLMTRDCAVKQ